jgi:MFS family permease
VKASRNLWVLLAAIFLIACAEELWWRFIPAYLRALGATVTIVALFGTFKDLLDALYQFPGGFLTQRLGHRNALLLFNGVAMAGYAAFASAHSWAAIIVFLPLVMAWQSFSLPATFSLIADLLPKHEYSIAFAYQSIVRRIPVVVAPIVGGAIISHLGVLPGTSTAIWIGAFIASIALTLQALRYRIPADPMPSPSFGTLMRDVPKLPAKLKQLLLADIIVRFGQGTAETFVVLFALGVVGISPASFGWLIGLAMTTSIAVYIPVARAADKRGRERWVLLTYAFFALFPLMVSLSASASFLTLAFVAMGLREIGEPPRKAMIIDLARADRRSVDVGTYYLVRGLAVFPASLLGGWLWTISPRLTFAGAAAVTLAGAVTYAVTMLKARTHIAGSAITESGIPSDRDPETSWSPRRE